MNTLTLTHEKRLQYYFSIHFLVLVFDYKPIFNRSRWLKTTWDKLSNIAKEEWVQYKLKILLLKYKSLKLLSLIHMGHNDALRSMKLQALIILIQRESQCILFGCLIVCLNVPFYLYMMFWQLILAFLPNSHFYLYILKGFKKLVMTSENIKNTPNIIR